MTTPLLPVSLAPLGALLRSAIARHWVGRGSGMSFSRGKNSRAITWVSSLAAEFLFLRLLFILHPYLDTYFNYSVAVSYVIPGKAWHISVSPIYAL